MPPTTPQTRPDLPWQRLVSADGRISFPWVYFAVIDRGNLGAYIYVWSQKTGNTYERPCSQPDRAARWAIMFAQQGN